MNGGRGDGLMLILKATWIFCGSCSALELSAKILMLTKKGFSTKVIDPTLRNANANGNESLYL